MIFKKVKNKKNLKKVLKLFGFLIFGGLTTLSVLLITSGSNSSPTINRSNPKTLIDHKTLKASSFEFVNKSSKTIRWRSGVSLPKQTIIKYFKSSSNANPSSDNDYETSEPTNLNNGDNIYIKFFIKEEYKTTYKFDNKFNNLIHMKVENNQLKTIIDISNLKASSFALIGNSDNATIAWKKGLGAPILQEQVKIKYQKANKRPSLENGYNDKPPKKLINGDIIHIKFFVRDEFITSHQFPTSGFINPIRIVFSKPNAKKNRRIIQDSNGNIWATSSDGKFMVLTKNPDGSFAKSWTSNRKENRLLKGSNIIFNINGFIFEDSSGNIWAMGNSKPLQVLTKNHDGSFAQSWKSNSKENGLLKGSNITDGEYGVIFEDSSGNIWAMGNSKPLQVLTKNHDGSFAQSWKSNSKENGLLKGSNITDGEGGVIFEDSSGNIWAMGNRTPLQVLTKNRDGSFAQSWKSNSKENGLLKGSNIINGEHGVIFEDSSGNIWAMGSGTPLQVLVKKPNGNYADSWISDSAQEGLLKDSNITNGEGGVIFEDSSGNIWAMGNRTPLQVLTKNPNGNFAPSWKSNSKENGLLKGSNITDGFFGTIFEDSSGNLWAISHLKSLQVLPKKLNGKFASSWESRTQKIKLLNGSQLTDGSEGFIFEDSSGNLWARGSSGNIQVLRKNDDQSFSDSWTIHEH